MKFILGFLFLFTLAMLFICTEIGRTDILGIDKKVALNAPKPKLGECGLPESAHLTASTVALNQQTDAKPWVLKSIPHNATEVTHLGNHWYTFNLELGNVNRTFLVHAQYTIGRVELLTELRIVPNN